MWKELIISLEERVIRVCLIISAHISTKVEKGSTLIWKIPTSKCFAWRFSSWVTAANVNCNCKTGCKAKRWLWLWSLFFRLVWWFLQPLVFKSWSNFFKLHTFKTYPSTFLIHIKNQVFCRANYIRFCQCFIHLLTAEGHKILIYPSLQSAK